PFYVWDMAERFERDVVADFVGEYAEGRTPNPCLRCNEKIKFAAVLDRAVALGFDAVCTGHHARLDGGRLRRSVDTAKDQSYVLAVLNRRQLDLALFPLGGSTKEEVRAEAAARGLAVADKPDSHDVCFIPDGDTRAFLAGRLGSAPGRIVAEDGTELGTHDGAYGFTIGPRESLDVADIAAQRPVWTGCEPPSGERDCLVQLRAHGEVHPATARLDGDLLRIRLWAPARGVARGQAAVLYDGDAVLGSGTITATS